MKMDTVEKPREPINKLVPTRRGCPSAPLRGPKKVVPATTRGSRVMSAIYHASRANYVSKQLEMDKTEYRLSLKDAYNVRNDNVRNNTTQNSHVKWQEDDQEDNLGAINEYCEDNRKEAWQIQGELNNDKNVRNTVRLRKSKSTTCNVGASTIKPARNMFGSDKPHKKRQSDFPEMKQYLTSEQKYYSERASSVPHWFYGSKAEGKVQSTLKQTKDKPTVPKPLSDYSTGNKENLSNHCEYDDFEPQTHGTNSSVGLVSMLPIINQLTHTATHETKEGNQWQGVDDTSSDDLDTASDSNKHLVDVESSITADNNRCQPVLRTLPLQTDLEKYVEYLHNSKKRSSFFTNSFNRYVVGMPPRKGGPISRPYVAPVAPAMERQKSRFGEETLTAARLSTLDAGSYQGVKEQQDRVNSSQRKLRVQLSDNIVRSGSGSRSHLSMTSSSKENTVSA